MRSMVKTMIKRARMDIDGGRIDEAQSDVRRAISALDKAANKGIILKITQTPASQT